MPTEEGTPWSKGTFLSVVGVNMTHRAVILKEAECHFCHKQGHIASVCRQKAKRQAKPPKQPKPQKTSAKPTRTIEGDKDTSSPEYPMYNFRLQQPLVVVELQIHNVPVRMEVDTEATL